MCSGFHCVGSVLIRHSELPPLNNNIRLVHFYYHEDPTVAKNLLSRLSHIVLPDSIRAFEVGVDDQAKLMELIGEQYRKEWAAIDDALSHPELEGLSDFYFSWLDTGEYVNQSDVPILSELLPKFYDRGTLLVGE